MLRKTIRLALPLILATSPIVARAQVAAPPPPAPASEDITVNAQAPEEVTRLPGPRDFISPMGEPFRSKDDLSGAEHWFAQADADGNGRMTLDEFKADEVRFFLSLDTDKDGDIGPLEIEHYEEYVAPEVKIASTWGNMSKAKTDNDGKFVPPPYPERLGAGRLSYLALPEPVVYADTNLDRGISRREFNDAAEKRFKMLDRNGDGRLTRAEMPKVGG